MVHEDDKPIHTAAQNGVVARPDLSAEEVEAITGSYKVPCGLRIWV